MVVIPLGKNVVMERQLPLLDAKGASRAPNGTQRRSPTAKPSNAAARVAHRAKVVRTPRAGRGDWRLDRATRERGLRGVAEARLSLQAAIKGAASDSDALSP